MNQVELFFPRVAATVMPMAVSASSPPVRTVSAPAPASPPPRTVAHDTPYRFEDVEVEARVTYTVRLADYPHSGTDAAKVAEQRFRRELDKQLGGDVVVALRAFQNASESSESDLSKAEIAMAKRWAKAYDAARTAGFRDLGDTDEAFFDVRPI